VAAAEWKARNCSEEARVRGSLHLTLGLVKLLPQASSPTLFL